MLLMLRKFYYIFGFHPYLWMPLFNGDKSQSNSNSTTQQAEQTSVSPSSSSPPFNSEPGSGNHFSIRMTTPQNKRTRFEHNDKN